VAQRGGLPSAPSATASCPRLLERNRRRRQKSRGRGRAVPDARSLRHGGGAKKLCPLPLEWVGSFNQPRPGTILVPQGRRSGRPQGRAISRSRVCRRRRSD
jgi:hypothetical protein